MYKEIMPTVENPIVYYLDMKEDIISEFPFLNIQSVPNIGDLVWLPNGVIYKVIQKMHRYSDNGQFSVCVNVKPEFDNHY